MSHELTQSFYRERRKFLLQMGAGLGWVTAAELLGSPAWAQGLSADKPYSRGILTAAHFRPTAKRVIYLFQAGGPSQLDLFDYKPKLVDLHGQELPDSVRDGQRLT